MAGQKIKIPTDRNFGFTFAVVFGLAGSWLWWKKSQYGLHVLGAGAVFALLAAIFPKILHPLNIVWMQLGRLLNMIVSPIVLGVIFFLVFTPVALWFRLIRRDALNRKFDRASASYWFHRTPPGPDAESFPQQF